MKYILNAYDAAFIRKEERSKTNGLSFHIKLEKEQIKPNVSRKKEG